MGDSRYGTEDRRSRTTGLIGMRSPGSSFAPRDSRHESHPTLRISCEAVPPSVWPAGAQGGTSACNTGAALSFVSCIRLLAKQRGACPRFQPGTRGLAEPLEELLDLLDGSESTGESSQPVHVLLPECPVYRQLQVVGMIYDETLDGRLLLRRRTLLPSTVHDERCATAAGWSTPANRGHLRLGPLRP